MQDPEYCEIYSLQTSFLIQRPKLFTEIQYFKSMRYRVPNLTGHLKDLAGLDCRVVGRVGDGAGHRHLLHKPGSPIISRFKKTTWKQCCGSGFILWIFVGLFCPRSRDPIESGSVSTTLPFKEVWHEIISFWFFHKSVSAMPLNILLEPFRIFTKIREFICRLHGWIAYRQCRISFVLINKSSE